MLRPVASEACGQCPYSFSQCQKRAKRLNAISPLDPNPNPYPCIFAHSHLGGPILVEIKG